MTQIFSKIRSTIQGLGIRRNIPSLTRIKELIRRKRGKRNNQRSLTVRQPLPITNPDSRGGSVSLLTVPTVAILNDTGSSDNKPDATSDTRSDTGQPSADHGALPTANPTSGGYSQLGDSSTTPDEFERCHVMVAKKSSPDQRKGEPSLPVNNIRLLENDSDDSIYTKDIDLQVAGGSGLKIRRRAKLDTGAQVNIMAQDVQKYLCRRLEPYDGFITPFGAKPIKPLGVVRGVEWNFKHRAKTYSDDFFVFETDLFDTLIGKPFIKEHNLYEQNKEVFSISGG